MSPIIEQQRRLVEAGRIRGGDRDANGRPRKGKFWRLTSKDRRRLEAAALLWGGTVQEWDEQFELQTDTAELPIMLLPDTEPSLWYELWSKGGCQRRCDGVTEILSDSPCLCGDERQCKPHLRFPVLLPDIPGIGSWLVQSTGWNASNEIPGAIALLTKAAAQGVLMPARLRLEQCVEVKAGQTRRYVKPVIDIDVSFRDLVGQASVGPAPNGGGALPGGYKPIAERSEVVTTLEQGLHEAETQTITRTPRSAAPFPDIPADNLPEFGPAPSGPDEPGAPSPSELPTVPQAPPSEQEAGNTVARSTRDKPATKPQKDKLNIIVARLSEAGSCTRRTSTSSWPRCARESTRPKRKAGRQRESVRRTG